MPEPIPRTPRREDDGDLPFWLSPWPFLEPRYPDWLPPVDEPA